MGKKKKKKKDKALKALIKKHNKGLIADETLIAEFETHYPFLKGTYSNVTLPTIGLLLAAVCLVAGIFLTFLNEQADTPEASYHAELHSPGSQTKSNSDGAIIEHEQDNTIEQDRMYIYLGLGLIVIAFVILRLIFSKWTLTSNY